MTNKEKQFVERYLDYYKKYDGNIPYEVWTKEGLSDLRESLGISLKRLRQLTIEAVKSPNFNDEQKDNNQKKSFHSIFYNRASNWFGFLDSADCTVGKNILDDKLSALRQNFGINLDEEIVFMRDTSFWSVCNQGTVITDKAIYCIPDNDKMDERILYWSEFDNVKYKELSFYFYSEGKLVDNLHSNFFFKGVDSETLKTIGPKLAKLLTDLSHLYEKDVNPLDLAEEGKYEEAINVSDDIIKNAPDEADGYFFKARILYLREGAKSEVDEIDESALEEALSLLDSAEELVGDIPQNLSLIHWNKANVNSALGRNYMARNEYILALDECDRDDRKELMREIKETESCMKDLWDNYVSNYDYKDRKYIMPIKDNDIAGCVVNDIDVFRMSNIPSCFRFPAGHPVANQLYIGHPYNPSFYVPIEESEDLFFVDKVHELCYLLECLGAEEISLTSVKGKSVSELSQNEMHRSANADVKLFSGEGSMDKSGSSQKDATSHNERSMLIRLDPMRKPFVPEGLVWYPEQPQWQRLVKSRMDSNMLEYNEFVSTSQTKFTNDSEKSEIKGSAKYLWMKAHAEVELSLNRQFKESEETRWKVEVKFRSIRDLCDTQDAQLEGSLNTEKQSFIVNLTTDEKSYVEEIMFCLESDGSISDRERRFLNRMREKFNISEERAKELEEMCTQPQLTEDEKEYLEAIKEEITDGIIPERSRRLLERLRLSMDIDEDRANEIERIALK